MATFTIILDFKGGTYISQVKARNPQQACLKWAAQIKPVEIADLGAIGKTQLQESLVEDTPVLLSGLTNVWCCSARTRNSLALINIVKTQLE